MREIDKEDIGTVIEMNGDEAVVELKRKGACKNCAVSSLCMGQDTSVKHKIKTNLMLKKGDKVGIEIDTKVKLLSSTLVFIFPVLFMVIVYSLSKLIGFSENLAIFLAILSLPISALIIKILDKKYAGKIKFEINGLVKNEDISE